MASVENLDNLSNSEIRLKCIEFGLPNVPVTESSRKILLKRLREAMIAKNDSGNMAETTISKSSGRRETIHSSKNTELNNEPLSLSQPVKTRRTIAATAAAAVAVAIAPAVSKDDTTIVAPTSIPVSTRRRSVQKEIESKQTSKSKSASVTPIPISTIIIEDEEDNDLVAALENAEKESTTSSIPIETITTRRKSRSVSVPKVNTENITVTKNVRALTPLVEEQQAVKEKNKGAKPKKFSPEVTVSNNNAASQKSYQPTISSTATIFTQPIPKTPIDMATGNWYGVYDKEKKSLASNMGLENSYANRYSLQSNTSTVYSSPAMRYSIGGVGSSMASYRTQYTEADIMNEQSDTDGKDDADGLKSPYLSTFARTLERSRSVGRSVKGPLKRRSGSNYDKMYGTNGQYEPTFAELISGLNRRYNLKNIMIIIMLLSVSIFAYIWKNSN